MEKMILKALAIEVRAATSMVTLIGVLALLRSLGKIPETVFKYGIEMYVGVKSAGFDTLKKKVEHILEVTEYIWWQPEYDRDTNTWYAKECPYHFSTAFEAPDEDAANIYIEKVLEYKTTN